MVEIRQSLLEKYSKPRLVKMWRGALPGWECRGFFHAWGPTPSSAYQKWKGAMTITARVYIDG